MQLSDILAQAGGFQSIANELGINESQVASVAQTALPAILGGIKKQVDAQGGVQGVLALIEQHGGANLLQEVLSSSATNTSGGVALVKQMLGASSTAVAQQAASQSGVDAGIVQKMLPMLTMLVAGHVSQQGAAAPASAPATDSGGLGGLGNLIGGLFGGNNAGSSNSGGGAAAVLNALIQAHGTGASGTGNALDDILKLAGKL